MMKTIKRIMAYVLSLLMISGTFALAADTASGFEPGEHTETIAFLNALNLIDPSFVSADSSRIVSRGEFAKLISDITPAKPSLSFDPVFSDVPPSHSYAPYIYAVKNAGYMNGTSALEFSPDEPVYYEQAVSVCVKIAGYGPVADTFGTYPESYLHQASRMEILDNISQRVGTPVSKGNLIELIYNTLLCDMMIVTGYGDEGSYVIYEGENILSYYHKIKEATGIVRADNIYTMTSSYSGRDDLIIINNEQYTKADNSLLNNSVGRQVRLWYRTEGSEKILLHAVKYDSTEIILRADQDLDVDISKGIYMQYTASKTYEYKLNINYDVVYNMEELSRVTKTKLLPKTGRVTLIDNNDDRYYDVVIVDEFTNLVVDMYNKSLNTISDLLDESRNVRLDDLDVFNIYDKGGNLVPLEKIKPKSVLEIYKSDSGKRITAIVSSNTISARIDELSQNSIILAGIEYKLSSDIRADVSKLNFGSEYEFYINADAELVYWTLGSGYKQGYVLAVDAASGMDDTVRVKLFTQNGKVEIYPLADKVKNMTDSSVSSIKKTNWSLIFDVSTYNQEFILYELNSKNELSTIVHAKRITDRNDFGADLSYPLQRLDFFCTQWEEMGGYVYPRNSYNTDAVMHFKGGINGFDNMLIFTEDAKLYRVPEIKSGIDENNVSLANVSEALYTDYEVGFSPSYTGSNKTMITYMVGDSYPFANVMVEHNGSSGMSLSDEIPSATVVAIRDSYDTQSKESSYFLELWNGEKIEKVYIKNKSILSRSNFYNQKIGKDKLPLPLDGRKDHENKDVNETPLSKLNLEVGDIIKYNTDEMAYLNKFALLYDSTVTKQLFYDTSGFGSQFNLSKGEVTKVRNNFVEVKVERTGSKTAWEIINVSELPTLIVDPKKDKPYIGSALDIEVGDTVLRYSKTSSNRHLTIYKN